MTMTPEKGDKVKRQKRNSRGSKKPAGGDNADGKNRDEKQDPRTEPLEKR